MSDAKRMAWLGVREACHDDGVPDHRVIALPLKADGARNAAMRAPPRLGAGTKAILRSLGLRADKIDRLRARGAIG